MSQSNSPQGYDLDNPAYIEANRMGRIAPEQRAMLESQFSSLPSLIGLGCQAIFLLIFLLTLGFVGIIFLITWEIPSLYKISLGVLWVAAIALIVIRSGSRYFQKRATLRKDLENAMVRRAEGKVSFGKKGYQIEAQGQTLTAPWFARRDSLAPGITYNFYYLPESGLILSAEKLSFMAEMQAQDELNKILAQANKFHSTALPLNRQGKLAQEQLSQVRSKLIAPLLFIILSIGLIGYQLYQQITRHGKILLNTGFFIMGIIAFALAIFGAYSLYKSLSDILQRRVIALEGPGHKEKRVRTDDEGSDTTYYYYVIGEDRFQVSHQAYQALIDGLQYRVYCTPQSKTLVNIEALESPYQEE